jgi:predicted amidohydrolase
MSRKTSDLRVGLAQTDCRLGNVAANLEQHLEWIERAGAEGVELLLFPELSLTGYRLLHLTSQVARRIGDAPEVERLAKAAGDMVVVFGMVEEDAEGVLYNSAVLVRRGKVEHVHRKLYLPTYGIFQEGRFFGPGQRLEPAPMADRRFGLLVCEDLWHPGLARSLAVGGMKILLVISAGPGRIGTGELPASQESWEVITRSTALVNTCWVLYCNRTGWEEGSFYTGGSHIVRPGGEILDRAAFLEEELLIADIDPREVDRVRWRLPLVRDMRNDIQGPGL